MVKSAGRAAMLSKELVVRKKSKAKQSKAKQSKAEQVARKNPRI
jgi:hypothetical protein